MFQTDDKGFKQPRLGERRDSNQFKPEYCQS